MNGSFALEWVFWLFIVVALALLLVALFAVLAGFIWLYGRIKELLKRR